MATTFFVPGPCNITWSNTSGGTHSTLGYSADTLPSVTVHEGKHEVKSTFNGDAVVAWVNTGVWATVAVTLAKWDQSELDDMMMHCRGSTGATSPYASMVGKFVESHASGFIELKISPAITGRVGFLFKRAHLVEANTYTGWGNETRSITLTFHCVPQEGTSESIIMQEVTT